MNKVKGPIYFIGGERGGAFPYCNSTFVDADKRVLIDTASNREKIESLEEKKPFDIVVVTHMHLDHVRHLDMFSKARIMVHKSEADAMKNIDKYAKLLGAGEDKEYIKTWKSSVKQLGYVETKPDKILKGGETIDLGNTTMQIIHAPGHTPGHLIVYFPKEKVLHTTDIDFHTFGAWYGNPGSDIDQFLETLNKIREIEAEYYITGHELGIVRGDINKMLDKFEVRIYEREDRVMRHLEEAPSTLDDLCGNGIIYKKHMNHMFPVMEKNMLSNHLKRLMNLGLLSEEEGVYYTH